MQRSWNLAIVHGILLYFDKIFFCKRQKFHVYARLQKTGLAHFPKRTQRVKRALQLGNEANLIVIHDINGDKVEVLHSFKMAESEASIELSEEQHTKLAQYQVHHLKHYIYNRNLWLFYLVCSFIFIPTFGLLKAYGWIAV